MTWEAEERVDMRRRVEEIRGQRDYARNVGGEPMPSELAIDDLLAALDAADRDAVEADDRARGLAFEIMQIHDALAQAGNALDHAVALEWCTTIEAVLVRERERTKLVPPAVLLRCELVLRAYGDAMRAADEVAERVGEGHASEKYDADLAFEVAFDEVVDLSKKLSVAAAAGTPVLVLEEEP